MFNVFYNKRKAFTLVEVLIVIGIIGIVSAITISIVKPEREKQITISQFKKYHSVISSAFNNYASDNDCAGNMADCEIFNNGASYSGAFSEKVWNAIKPYLKVMRDCGSTVSSGCIENYSSLMNVISMYGDSFNYGTKSILADGVALQIVDYPNNCTTDRSSTNSTPLHDVCGYFILDFNGKSLPNKLGRDVFFGT